jgi:hypothetical protein
MAKRREFGDFYAGGGIANPVMGTAFMGFGLTEAQKAALDALPVIDAETATIDEVMQATEELVTALKG